MTYVKKSHTKRNLAVILIAIIAVATVAVAYSVLTAKQIEVGVKAGDTFTYKITGISNPFGSNATETPGFYHYNQTEYFKVNITDVTGTTVTLQTTWRFKNSTEIYNTQIINIANGEKSDENGFWAIYPANLNIGDLLRPTGYDGNIVNNTDTYKYKGEERSRCYWWIDNQFQDVHDPTGSTLLWDYRSIFFDRETGMLTSFVNNQFYNNPQKEERIIWNLIESSLWNV
ncbi:MAG: hypothetical protein PHY74_05710 [Candidatus Bathyarchaeota archaeon]|nr:hypothetical protein [Candidatus Bathyarchaeota archaeon]MDD4326417.1 hypothetical protein [Candidatus Bathyarchaeota archaeon]MDI9577686.1 hypothetical protein [Thermoproteota archaeon]MDT8782487.1 hypothetical protein [Candidatus Bathyarchaeota archaeon]NLD66706.1 hypothetical protein [Thermoproteota archaeon]